MQSIAVVWDWPLASWAQPLAHDGLAAAMSIVAKYYKVDWYLNGDYPPDTYDWIMPWGVGSIGFNEVIQEYKGKKALLCAGHPQDTRNFEKFDIIFVESPEMRRQLSGKHKRIELAFGTDTDFFKPETEKKIFNAFYPATFSLWKRQNLFAGAIGSGLCCGTVQPDGIGLFEGCKHKGVYTLNGLVPSRLIAQLYNMSEVCVVTSYHGSERTVLEAMASNIPLVLTNDNILAKSLVNEEVELVNPTIEDIKKGYNKMRGKKVNTRKYILDMYSHYIYAQRILEALNDKTAN